MNSNLFSLMIWSQCPEISTSFFPKQKGKMFTVSHRMSEIGKDLQRLSPILKNHLGLVTLKRIYPGASWRHSWKAINYNIPLPKHWIIFGLFDAFLKEPAFTSLTFSLPQTQLTEDQGVTQQLPKVVRLWSDSHLLTSRQLSELR